MRAMGIDRPTDHREVEQIAADWLARRDGDAWTDADAAALQHWLQADIAHRVAFLRLQAAWHESARLKALGAGWRGDGPPPRGNLHAPPALRLRTPRPAALPRQGWATRVAVSLAVAVCVLGGGIGWRTYHRVDAASHRTAPGQVQTLPLADGSRVTLASDSHIDVRLSRGMRRIVLARGEAIFEVAKDAGRPFVVDAGERQVIAVGTRFSVREDGDALRVVVTEGTVRLESANGTTQPSALLPAGSVALADAGGVLVRSVALADAQRLLDWRDGLLAFHDTPLAEAVAEFNRYNARKLEIADGAAGALRIGGSFRWDNQDAFVRLLEAGFPVRAERRADRIVLHSR